ncbi:MAG: hypothetical protein P4L99_28180 [Chthoniobacter sp.]|nr:hypothetical protein [Chthoniobacter sp.]
MIDRNVILSVVWILGAIALTLSGGIVWIAAHGQQIDAGLSGLDGTCIGAIGGLLTSLHKSDATTPDPEPPKITTP